MFDQPKFLSAERVAKMTCTLEEYQKEIRDYCEDVWDSHPHDKKPGIDKHEWAAEQANEIKIRILASASDRGSTHILRIVNHVMDSSTFGKTMHLTIGGSDNTIKNLDEIPQIINFGLASEQYAVERIAEIGSPNA